MDSGWLAAPPPGRPANSLPSSPLDLHPVYLTELEAGAPLEARDDRVGDEEGTEVLTAFLKSEWALPAGDAAPQKSALTRNLSRKLKLAARESITKRRMVAQLRGRTRTVPGGTDPRARCLREQGEGFVPYSHSLASVVKLLLLVDGFKELVPWEQDFGDRPTTMTKLRYLWNGMQPHAARPLVFQRPCASTADHAHPPRTVCIHREPCIQAHSVRLSSCRQALRV